VDVISFTKHSIMSSLHGHFHRYVPDFCMGSDEESEDDIDYAKKMKKLRSFRSLLDSTLERDLHKYKFRIRDIPEPEYVISKKRMKSVCAQCGTTDAPLKRFHLSSYYSVCVEGPCAKKFGSAPFGMLWYDLSDGVPYIMKTDSAKDIELRNQYCCEILPISMTCSYCDNNNVSEVVAHPRIPKHYKWNVFCKNKTCFRKFVIYTDALEKLREIKKIPSAIYNDAEATLGLISYHARSHPDLGDFFAGLDLSSVVAKHPSVAAVALTLAAVAAVEAEAREEELTEKH
jgi:hypothetical protein